MVVLQNSDLTIEINEKGAELNRLFNKKTKKEYLWSGDEKFWGRKAPVLFPIVGKLKDNRMFYKGNEYLMSQHGFARDLLFDIEVSDVEKVVFSCKSNEETKKIFPFDCSVYIEYIIGANEVDV